MKIRGRLFAPLCFAMAVFLATGMSLLGLVVAHDSVRAAARLSITHVDASRYPEISFQLHVINPSGIPPSSLPAAQFAVSDGARSVPSFRSHLLSEGQRGTDILLLIDNGISTHGATIDANKAAAQSFLSGLGAHDRVAVTFFDSKTHPRTGFTGDKSTLESALNDLQAHGQSRIYDALYTSLQRLNDAHQRYAVILPTDGADVHSRHTKAQCIALARQLHIPLYTVALGTTPVLSVLGALSAGTGGQLFHASNTAELQSVFRRLVLVFRHDYLLTYRAPTVLHRGQQVEVRVRYNPPGAASAEASGSYTVPFAPWLHLSRAPATLGTVEDPRRIAIPVTLTSEDDVAHRVSVAESGWPGLQLHPTSLLVPPHKSGPLHTTLTLGTQAGFAGGLQGTLTLSFRPVQPAVHLDRTSVSLPYRLLPSLLRIADVPQDLGSITDMHSGHRISFTVSSTVFRASDLQVVVSGAPPGTVSPSVLHIPSARAASSSTQTVMLRVPDAGGGRHGALQLHFRALTPGVRVKYGNSQLVYYVPTWWERNWKWVVPTVLLSLIALYIAIALSWESITKTWDTRRRMVLGR